MDIELKLREMLVLKDPGVRFTDSVLSRVGNAGGPVPDGVVHLADARMSRRPRRLLLGALLVAGAAAAMLPFMPGRGVDEPEAQQSVTLAASAGGASPTDSAAPTRAVHSDASHEEEDPDNCIDPDVLYGLLLPGQLGESFRTASVAPAELSAFKAPRELTWLGGTERGSGAVVQSSAVYRTGLAPDAARVLAGEALEAGGWKLHADGWSLSRNMFVSSGSGFGGDTYCQEGMPVNVTSSALDGVTYVVLTVNRTPSAAGFITACDQPQQFMTQATSPMDAYMPTLELPRDPTSGRPVTMRGSGGTGGGGSARRQANVSFTVGDSLDNVSRHFANQMAGQGWHAGTVWSGAGSAGSTWSRRLDNETVLQGALLISAFENDRFTAIFRAMPTK